MLRPERLARAAKLLASDFLEEGVIGHEVKQAGRILESVVHLSELPAALGGRAGNVSNLLKLEILNSVSGVSGNFALDGM